MLAAPFAISAELDPFPSVTVRRLSIIIPAFNEEKLLGRTLEAVREAKAAFTDRGWSVEVIVCNNNSTDRTADIAQNQGAIVVFEPVNQIGRARNRGAAAATGDWLLFIDADSQPSRELLAEAAQAIASGRILACGAAVKLDVSEWWARLLAAVWVAWSRLARHMAGSFIAVDATAFRELGGFSPHLYAGEELDLSHRLKKIARRDGKRVVILTRHPLLTSGRKIHLYTFREALAFLFRFARRPRRVLTTREECAIWYDGRR